MNTIEEKAQSYAEQKFQEVVELYQIAPWPEFRAKIAEIYLAGAMEALSTQWRDATKEVPDIGMRVLLREIYTNVNTPIQFYPIYYNEYVFSTRERFHRPLGLRITHWMPIPELPKHK